MALLGQVTVAALEELPEIVGEAILTRPCGTHVLHTASLLLSLGPLGLQIQNRFQRPLRQIIAKDVTHVRHVNP